MTIKAGQLDRRLRLQRPVTAKNSFGEEVVSFVDVATVYAKLATPVPGREDFSFDQHSAKQPVVFEIRYRTDLGPKWRVVYDGSTYEVEDVGEIGRREGLRLTAYARNVVSGAG